VTKRIAVIGAYVMIFEQDRNIGGRIATTRIGIVPYDHGAQLLTARSAQFRGFIDELCSAGYAAPWKPKTS
jgi:renalase